MNLQDRDTRQRDIVPADALAETRALVVGVGAIGRQAALQLAAVGVGSITLIDHEAVEVENLAPQGYLESDLGRPKVEAAADSIRAVNSQIAVETVHGKYHPSLDGNGCAVFSCVDSMEARRRIWSHTPGRRLLIDGRMSAMTARVITDDGHPGFRYDATLFGDEEAYRGSCTAKSTIYTASIAAGLMVNQMVLWMRGLELERDLTLNLLAMELAVANPGADPGSEVAHA